MELNDLVCCFCLATLRKIEKFTKMAKEVDSILKHSIKTEEDANEVNKYYNLAVSRNRSISIECSRAVHETYSCNIRDALLTQVETDLVKKEEMEDEPLQLSEHTFIDDGTASTSDVPLLTATVNKEEQNESADQTESALPKQLKRTSSNEENIFVTELPCEEDLQQNITPKLRNKININDVLSKAIKDEIANEISEQNDVDTICSIDKPFSCDTCAYRAKCKSDLTKHLRRHAGETSFSCKIFSHQFSHIRNLRVLRTHRDEKPVSCNICSYKCSLKSELRTHIGEKPFSCKICSHKFSQQSNLARHLRTHTGEKPFSCNICSHKFSQKSDLGVHLRTHTGVKPFSCKICTLKFSQKSNLRVHLRSHTGEKPFSCNICSHTFSRKSNLTVHLRKHTGETPFSCNNCSYKCSQKIDLARHLRTHTGEKPFSCKICTLKFSQKSNLTVHLRKHTGESPFSCNNCSYKCSQKIDLARHLRTHTGEKPFSCNICLHKFSLKGNLRVHLRKHTGEKFF